MTDVDLLVILCLIIAIVIVAVLFLISEHRRHKTVNELQESQGLIRKFKSMIWCWLINQAVAHVRVLRRVQVTDSVSDGEIYICHENKKWIACLKLADHDTRVDCYFGPDAYVNMRSGREPEMAMEPDEVFGDGGIMHRVAREADRATMFQVPS